MRCAIVTQTAGKASTPREVLRGFSGRSRAHLRRHLRRHVRGPVPGQASGRHRGLRHPDDDQRIKQALDEADLADQGESVEDELRDRRGRGLADDDIRSDRGDDEHKAPK